MIVDHQTHWYPPAYFEAIRGRRDVPRAERTADGWRYEPREGVEHRFTDEWLSLDGQLAAMEAAGIGAMVSSPALLGDVAHLERPLAVELTTLLNEESADAQRAHAGRFLGLAMAPLDEPDVLSRAHADGLRGLCVVANGAAGALPLYRRADELGMTPFLHPSERSSAAALTQHRAIEVGVNWMWDTTVAALSLIYGGVLDECPNLTVVHPHLGGTIPYLAARLAGFERFDASAAAARPVTEYLRTRFYADSLNPTPGALALGVQLYGLDRILFASDAPFVDRSVGLAVVRDGLDEADAARVFANRVL